MFRKVLVQNPWRVVARMMTVAETLFHFDLMDAEILVHRLAAGVRSQMTKHYASGPFVVCHETVRSHFT